MSNPDKREEDRVTNNSKISVLNDSSLIIPNCISSSSNQNLSTQKHSPKMEDFTLHIPDIKVLDKVNLDSYGEYEAIRDRRISKNGNVYYLIKWKNEPEEKNTWESYEKLNVIEEEIRAYELQSLKKLGPFFVNFVEVKAIKIYNGVKFCIISAKFKESTEATNVNEYIIDLVLYYELIVDFAPLFLINFYENLLAEQLNLNQKVAG